MDPIWQSGNGVFSRFVRNGRTPSQFGHFGSVTAARSVLMHVVTQRGGDASGGMLRIRETWESGGWIEGRFPDIMESQKQIWPAHQPSSCCWVKMVRGQVGPLSHCSCQACTGWVGVTLLPLLDRLRFGWVGLGRLGRRYSVHLPSSTPPTHSPTSNSCRGTTFASRPSFGLTRARRRQTLRM